MATIRRIEEVIFSLVNGTTIGIDFPGAAKAYNDFLAGRPVKRTIENEEDAYPQSAIASAHVTYFDDEVDMTDNSCIEGLPTGTVFMWGDTPITEDMQKCYDVESGVFGALLIPNGEAPDGYTYTLRFGNGEVLTNPSEHGGVRFSYNQQEISFFPAPDGNFTAIVTPLGSAPSSCEDAIALTVETLRGARVTWSGDAPK